MKSIRILSIPSNQQRYETCGDYFEKDGVVEVRINDCGNYKAEMLVTIHELIEAFLTTVNKVPWKTIDDYDKHLAEVSPELEPGEQIDAPYRREHTFAEWIERILCQEVGMTWDEYGEIIEKSYANKKDSD